MITPDERVRIEQIKQAVRTARGSMEAIKACEPLDDIALSVVALFELRQEQQDRTTIDAELGLDP